MRIFNNLAIVRYSRFNQPNKIFAFKFRDDELPNLELMVSHENIDIVLLEDFI